MEELENLEETLNENIRESLGARSGTLSHGKKKAFMEEEEDCPRYHKKELCVIKWKIFGNLNSMISI